MHPMSENETKNFALVPRPPSALEKMEPGAKRILSGMVADTLALVRKTKSQTPRIIVVDDDDDWLKLLEAVIHWFKDAEIVTFSSSLAALRELEHRDPDLLITGDKMPRMTGEELVRRLIAKNVNYPILVLTGHDEAQQWVREYADRGHNIKFLSKTDAQHELKRSIENILPDKVTSATNDWLEKGNAYWKSKNHAEAFLCFRKAAEQGNAKAQELVGEFLICGWGVVQDKQEALKWFTQSVKRGNTGAACFVGEWFIETDYAEAYKWLTLAIEQGDKRAAAGLKTLESWMSPQDLLEGKRCILQFHAQDVLL
jgi:CheY-like chemotaxis protein